VWWGGVVRAGVRKPLARYFIYRECFSFDVESINQLTIFVSIDPYIPTMWCAVVGVM